jgi:hypothetical protein
MAKIKEQNITKFDALKEKSTLTNSGLQYIISSKEAEKQLLLQTKP